MAPKRWSWGQGRLAGYFEDINTPVGLWINVNILALTLLSLLIFVALTYPLPPVWQTALHRLDTLILILFTGEYLLRLWAAPAKLAFIFDFFSLIDLVSIIPLFLGWFDVRFFRVLRWFRLLRLVRLAYNDLFAVQFKIKDQVIFIRIYLVIFSALFIYSGLIFQVEHTRNAKAFRNFFDALYFCVVTMTTVGFGDQAPVTVSGRILTMLMILTGIILIPWQVGDLVKQLLALTQSGENNQVCQDCGSFSKDPEAAFCKLCGGKLAPISSPGLS